MSRKIAAGLFVVFALTCPLAAAAESDAPPDEVRSQELVRQAVEEYDRGNFDEAKVLFAEAYQAFPNARALRGLGMVANAMRDYVRAIQYLERAIENRVRPLDGVMIAEARGVIARARKYVGTLRIATSPADCALSVDGWPSERSSDGTMLLNPGPHEIVAQAPGHQNSTRLVRMEPGATLEVEFVLVPRAMTQAEVQSERNLLHATDSSGSKTSIAPWIVVGASAAVAITGGVFLGLALDDVNTVEDAAPLEEWTKVESQYDRSTTRSTIGIVMIATGVAGVAAGLTWHFLDEEKAENVALGVSPGALTLRGKF